MANLVMVVIHRMHEDVPSSSDIVELVTSIFGIFTGFISFFLCFCQFGFDIIKSEGIGEQKLHLEQ